MVNKIFQFDNVNNRVELNVPEILLIKEFAALMDNKRNITKEDPKGKYKTRAFREFTYIWLAIDWQSIYADFSEYEKKELSMKDANMTEEEFNDPLFRAACRKYRRIQDETRCIKMLDAARNVIDKFIDYFNNIDPEERDEQTGKPIFKVKDLMDEISKLSKVNEELNILENQVKKQLSEQSQIRAGAVDGYQPTF